MPFFIRCDLTQINGTITLWILPTPWASYQIPKIAGCACAGNAGNVFPRRRFQRKPLISDPGMHHGTCVTHVPWCMSGSLTCGYGENVPGIPGACAPAILRIWQEAHGRLNEWFTAKLLWHHLQISQNKPHNLQGESRVMCFWVWYWIHVLSQWLQCCIWYVLYSVIHIYIFIYINNILFAIAVSMCTKVGGTILNLRLPSIAWITNN